MARARNAAQVFASGTQAAEALGQQDQLLEQKIQSDRAQRTSLLLGQIHQRLEDTRPLREKHVQDLAESIAALGLIEPLVVDSKGVLLAGSHRLAALQLLKQMQPESYWQQCPDDLIPVRMMPFDAATEPERALQVELAENEKRVNYSRDQIEKLAIRLRQLNYRDIPGRPKAGEKALGPALAVAIGVSTRYVRRVLNDQYENTRNSVPNFNKLKLLQKIEANLEELSSLLPSDPSNRADQDLAKALPRFLNKVKASLKVEQQTIQKNK